MEFVVKKKRLRWTYRFHASLRVPGNRAAGGRQLTVGGASGGGTGARRDTGAYARAASGAARGCGRWEAGGRRPERRGQQRQ